MGSVGKRGRGGRGRSIEAEAGIIPVLQCERGSGTHNKVVHCASGVEVRRVCSLLCFMHYGSVF